MSDERVKVRFTDPEGDTETLWGEPQGADRVRLLHAPFLVHGVSRKDVVQVEPESGGWRFERVVEKSGHRSLRLLLPPQRDPEPWVQEILRRGGRCEGAFGRIVAVDVPPEADFWSLCRWIATSGVEWELVDPTHEALYGEPASPI